ncbi:aaa-type atpase family protein-related [Anaeramoeba flamelloides]|uniref:Aaa-type atpase family protein-related n=1 Tax=Anaeramoeba flamelloides TaxID=1746091 RepID=A0ABQ8XSN6_9EUKA|nr:aaa-type atpase family protein-related [Anaeramoeba flamelloides]
MKMSKPISSVPTTNNPSPWGYLFIQTRLRQFVKLYDEKFTVGSSNKSKFQIVTNQKVLSSTLLRLTNRKDQSKMFLEVHGYQGTVFLNEKQIRRGHKIALKAGDRILIKTTIQNLVFVFLTTQFVQEFTQKHSLQIKEKTDYFKQIERKENEICQQIRKRLNELILHHSSLNPQIQFEDIEYPIDPLVIRQIQFTALLNLRDFSIKKSALFPNQSAKTLFVGPSERIVYNITKENEELFIHIKNLFLDQKLINKIKKINSNKWYKLIKQINYEFEFNLKYWKLINKIRKSSTKIILNNKNLEKTYFNYCQEISKKPEIKIIKLIKDYYFNKFEDLKLIETKDVFSLEKIYELIKYQKNKSVKDFDKIKFYKIDPKKKNEKEHLEFLKRIQQTFYYWIDNPNEEIINFIKERNILFIHKAGDEGIPLNYRPISINNTLARFFLKLIYKGIEESWNLVSDSQFGFKKKLDTRIAVLNLVFELEKLKNDYKNKEFFVVTIDIKKCFDTISHILVHYALDKYIRNEKIKIWLKNYYKKVGLGVYQGDPLSPLLFGFISHFLIEKIKHLAKHVQMFADDLILIMEGPISEIDKKLIIIFKIIQEFGMNPNTEKTLKSKTLSKIKYLGIWLEKEKHLKKNFEKVKDSFKKIKKIFSQQKLANGVKLQMFKSICISQLFYGLVIFNLNQKDFDSIDVWINKKVTKFLKINPHSPRIIYKTEAKLDQARISIYKRRYKLKKKLEILEFDHISQKLKFSKKKDENINWEIENLKLLNLDLNDFRQKLIINSSGWKGQEYLKIIKYNNNINKQQKYLKWEGSQILQETLIRAISDTFKAVNITISEDDFLDLFKREKKNDIQENESNVPVIYKFGDIVKYVGPQNYPNIAIQDQTEGPTAGDRGIVVSTFQDNHKSPIVGVLFQNEIPGGSDLGGICEKGTKCGFFFNQDELRPFHEEEIDTRALTIQTLLEYIEKNIAKSTPLVLCIKDIDKWVSKSNEVKQILKDRLEELEKNRLIMIIGSIANNKLNNKLNLSKNSESSRGSLTSGLSIFLPPNPNSRSAFGDNSRLNSSSTKSYGNTIEMIGGSLGVGTGGDSSSSVFKFLVELFPNTIFLQPIEKPSKISFWKDCIEKDNLSIQKNYNEILLERTLKKYQLSTSNLLILGNLLTQKRFTEEEMDMIVGFSFLSKYEKLFNKKIDKKNIIKLEKEFNSIVNKKSRKRLMNETKNNINIENNLNEKENQEKEIEIEIEIENENKEIEKTIEKENDTRNDNNQNHKIRKTRKNLDLKNINQNIDLNLNEEKKELPEKKNEMQEKNNNFSLRNTQNQKKFKYIYKESHSIIESKHLEYGIHILNKFYGKDRTTRLLETVQIDNEYEHQFLSEVIVPEEINIKFDQIGALHKIKKTLDDLVILPLRRPELFQRGNLLKACKGILLFGPPGTGKTMLAKAVATESGANFINVSMTKISSKWFGEGEKYAKAVFTLATKLAPSIIFIDEVDSFLNRRQTSHEHEASRKIKNTFMTEWDGLGMSDTERVIVLAATNRPFDLDEAVLRRLPRRLFVPMPNKEARKKILQTILSGEALEKNFDFDQLAEETDGYSGSDLKNLSISAAYEPIRDFLKKEKSLNPKLKKNEKKKSKVLTKKSSNTKFSPFRSFFDLDQDQDSQNNNSNNQLVLHTNKTETSLKPNLRLVTINDFHKAMKKTGISVSDSSFVQRELELWNLRYGEGQGSEPTHLPVIV